MRTCDLKELTGKEVREWYAWLRKNDEGCCSLWYASTDKYRYCVCMGWRKVDVDDGPGEPVTVGSSTMDTFKSHEEWRVYWKIGRQTHNNIMQTDLDIDFDMPYVTEGMAREDPELYAGDVDDTSEEVECEKIVRKDGTSWRWSGPRGYRDWNALAAYMRKQARRVFREWRDSDE